MVFLDVVYNHFGPDGAYLHAYGGAKFFDEGKHSPWGAAIDFNRKPVRDYFIQNAIYWLEEYRFDGLRFDAVHAIYANPDFARRRWRATIRTAIGPDRHRALGDGARGQLVPPPAVPACSTRSGPTTRITRCTSC